MKEALVEMANATAESRLPDGHKWYMADVEHIEGLDGVSGDYVTLSYECKDCEVYRRFTFGCVEDEGGLGGKNSCAEPQDAPND